MRKKMQQFIAMLLCISLALSAIAGCSNQAASDEQDILGNGWQVERSEALLYANNFNIEYFQDDYALIALLGGDRFLIVPENQSIPDGIHSDIVVIQQPVSNIYLAANAATSQFDALNAIDRIRLMATEADGIYIDSARQAMKDGEILYAGKYSAPDFELIISNDCPLAIESTMINRSPEVKEKLIDLGIPVLVDESSYESHPLGRSEWIKLYAALVGNMEQANQQFAQQLDYLNKVSTDENTGKTVAFFYVTSAGKAVVRRSEDYVSTMIDLAGGNSIFNDLDLPNDGDSIVSIDLESFYATAKEADYVIYNGSVAGELTTLEEFLAINPLFADFKAVKNNNVWCTTQNFFQETTQLGLMISDMHTMLTTDDFTFTQLNFIYKLL